MVLAFNTTHSFCAMTRLVLSAEEYLRQNADNEIYQQVRWIHTIVQSLPLFTFFPWIVR